MSIFDQRWTVTTAPSWRCPHCRTLQPVSSRCRTCLRATVTCSSCHRYRVAVAGGLGYCADDGARAPLSGEEVRSCWSARPEPNAVPGLFDDAELTAATSTAKESLPGLPVEPGAVVPDAPAAATGGRLIEAPVVAPRGRMTAADRAQGGRTPAAGARPHER